jgi:two-component system sensor histidine kinase RpfC
MQILVADDHEANRMVLQRLLQKAGHRVLCVDGGEAVLDALADSEFDAVIVDLHMPGMSGLDMLKELRVMQAGGGPRTPVLVLSAMSRPRRSSAVPRPAHMPSWPSPWLRCACSIRWPRSPAMPS